MPNSEPSDRGEEVPESEPFEASDIVDLQELVERWGHEFALEKELANVAAGIDVTWVSLAEAERRAGVSRSTLRTWYRSGQLASKLMPGPHGIQRLVPLEAILDRVERSPRTGRSAGRPAGKASDNASKEEPVTSGLSTPDAVVRLAEIAAATASERAEAAEARAAEAESALRAALERAAAAEAELRILKAQRN